MLDFARIFSLDGVRLGEDNNVRLMQLLLSGLYAMGKDQSDPMMISQTFMLRLVSDSGFLPELFHCLNCGRQYAAEGDATSPWFFNVEEGGLICPSCRRYEKYALRAGSITTLQHITRAELSRVYKFKVSDAIRKELKDPIRAYASSAAGFRPKSLEFAENLENMR